MTSDQTRPATVDEYIARFPADVQAILQAIRETVRNAAPQAEETISYQMPAFRQKGILIYFGAFKQHIGLYPPVTGEEQLVQEAAIYAGPKGNLRFPLDQPMPYDLVSRIVEFRLAENLAGAQAKRRR